MSRNLGDVLPDTLFSLLDGSNLSSKRGKAFLAVTQDPEGWPHPALLSYLEVAARDLRNIRLATWSNSSTSKNMRGNGKLTLAFVDKGLTYYAKGQAKEIQEELEGYPGLSLFNMEVVQVLEDIETQTPITSGILFDPSDVNEYAEMNEQLIRAILR